MSSISGRQLFQLTTRHLIVRCLMSTIGVCLMVAASTIPAFAKSTQSTPTPGSRTVIAGDMPAAIADATPVAALPGDQTLSLSVSLKLPNTQAVADLIARQNDEKSPLYHKYLTPQEFTSQFAPSQTNVNAVVSFLQGAGFKVTSVSSNRLLIDVTGTIAQANAAFNTQLYAYKLAQRQVMAPQQAPTLPSSVGSLVQDVGGLNTISINHPIGLESQDQFAQHTVVSSSYATTPQVINPHPRSGFSPSNLRAAYQVTSLINNGYNGSNERIAIFEQGPYLLNDVLTYRSTYGLPNSPINNFTVDGASSTGDASGTLEADLDLEVTSGLAPNATIDVLTAPNTLQGTNDLYNLFVTSDQDKILTTSWGLCEPQAGTSELQTLDNLFMQAAAQGQTMLAAAGDTGSDDCYNRNTDQPSGLPPSVDNPASDPYFLGVGGTTLSFNGSYQGESVWNSGGVAGGGGVSSYFTKPSWQIGTGVSNPFASNQREVPDITGVADQTPGYNTYCSSVHDCSIGSSVIGWAIVGGTSATAPLYAGMLADIDQYLRGTGNLLGWANQKLYHLYAYSGTNHNSIYYMFNDVTSGNNDIDYGGTSYRGDYPATACFDLASGMGSLNGWNIAQVAPLALSPSAVGPCATCPNVGASPTTSLNDLAVTNDGNLWNTIRQSSTGAWDKFANVKTATNSNPGTITKTATANINCSLNVLAVTSDGNLWHAIENPDGTWSTFGNVKVATNSNPGSITAVAAANLGGNLDIVAVTSDGSIWNTMRHSSTGAWDMFGDVKAATKSNPGSVTTAAVANVAGLANVVAVTSDGNIWHAIRKADGNWSAFGNAKVATNSNPGSITAVATANVGGNLNASSVGGDLDVVAVTGDGNIWNTIRHNSTGAWDMFGDVKMATNSNPGSANAIGAGNVGGLVNVLAVTSGGNLWHAIRKADGNWSAFGDVKVATNSNPGSVSATAGDGS